MRPATICKVSNTIWGLENRVLTTTSHALLESMPNFGQTVTGSAAPEEDFGRVDIGIMTPTARKVAAVGCSIRREALFALAG